MSASGTLSGQLRRRMTLLVAALAIVLSVGVLLAASSIFLRQLDSSLDAAQARQQRAIGGGNWGERAPGIDAVGMSEGTVIVAVWPDGTVRGDTIGQDRVLPLTVEAAEALLSVPADGSKHTLNVPGMGQYRVEGRGHQFLYIVVALPMEQLQRNLGWLTLFAAGLGLVSVAVAAVLTRAATDKITRPLRALGQASVEVAQLPLDTGVGALTTRVAPTQLPPTHEISQLTTAFNHMLANVEGALAARHASEQKLRQFVADASHELRNPLASIRGYSELAQKATGSADPAAADDVTFALGRINSESTRMSKLVHDLLLLARLDADAPLEPRPVDVVEIVLNGVSDARAADDSHNWRLELPSEGVVVQADANQLHQVVVNLLSNARTHTPAGTTVTASVRTEDGRAVLEVVDDGPGIPADIVAHVFERFSRADSSRAHTHEPSTGLGLAIVQAVVSRFGGTTAVESRPGQTRFTVSLPLAVQ